MLDKKIFSLQVFCSLLRDLFLYILQISKILSESSESIFSTKSLDKYVSGKHRFIFDVRNSAGDFKNIFSKIDNGINSLNIDKNIADNVKSILNDNFIEELCDYVHHNKYSIDHPYFFEASFANDDWCLKQLQFCLNSFIKIFNLFMISIFIFKQSSYSNMFEYKSELEFTGVYPSTDLSAEANENFILLIKEFNFFK